MGAAGAHLSNTLFHGFTVPEIPWQRAGFFGTLFANLFLLQAPWVGFDSWNGVSWSISAEFHAYLLFPIFSLVLARLNPASAALLALCCLVVVAQVTVQGGDSVAYVQHGALVLGRALPEFLLGMLVYRLYRSAWGATLWRRDEALAALTLAILALAAAWPTDLAIILLLPALLLAAAANESRGRTLLEVGPLVFLGKISYSVYMVHALCLTAVFAVLGGRGQSLGYGWLMLILDIALTLVVATLVSRCIEYPTRAALRRLFAPAAPSLNQPESSPTFDRRIISGG